MFSDVHNGNIRSRIALTGGLLIAVPLLVLSIAGWIVMQRLRQPVIVSGVRASTALLVNLTRNLADICRTYQQASLDTLKSGRSVLEAAGSISFNQGRLLAWRAHNEATGKITELNLPVMSVGNIHFLPVSGFDRPAPVVDEIEKINGTPATIFQRMNEQGDMLRICSSVKSPTGLREIGSYIPSASAPLASQALADVLHGKGHIANEIVSNARYLTDYQPLVDQAGKVVGMLSTSLPEDQIAINVRSLLTRQTSPDRVGLFAWRASGADRGTAVIMVNKSLEGQNLWNRTDSSGKLYVQQICARAMILLPGETAEYKYQQEPRIGAIPQPLIARFAYVPELDWVVGYAQPEADFLAGSAALQALLSWGMWLLLGVGLAGTGLAVRIWIKFSGDLADNLSGLLSNLTQDAKQVSVAAVELSAEAKRATGQTANEISLAIRHINASSHSVSGVMEAIDQIAFATDMLTVNSALEASHADGASQPVARIAEELRKLAERCRAAAHETQTELQDVLDLVRSTHQPDDAIVTLRRQAENLIRLADGLDRTVERMTQYLELGS